MLIKGRHRKNKIDKKNKKNKNIAAVIAMSMCAVLLFAFGLTSCEDIFNDNSNPGGARSGAASRSDDYNESNDSNHSDNSDNANNSDERSNSGGFGNYQLVLHHDDFIGAAEKAGYTIIIEEDYDGFDTYWAGAHKFAPGVVEKEGNEIYVIDYTRDASIHNAKVEFILYVDKVKEIGGTEAKGSGDDYEFQANSSDTRFGVAYRIGSVNMYVVADAEYKNEILAFLKAMDFGIDI
jgi:hypothetical protein